MNLRDAPAEAAFRLEARDWVRRHAPRELEQTLRDAPPSRLELPDVDVLRAARAWQRTKQSGGWACPHWPRAYGGRDASAMQRVIWNEEEGVYGRLSNLFAVGQGICGPTIIRFGTEAQKRAHLPAMASGDHAWVQCFSEPDAGSDLGALRTTAVRDGDAWVVEGRKVWISNIAGADFGLVLARTDARAPMYRGLTMFIVRLDLPRVQVRPLRQMTGLANFDEIVFDGVRVRDGQRLGAEGAGWAAALDAIAHERQNTATSLTSGFPDLLAWLAAVRTEGGPAPQDPALRSRLAGWAARCSGLKHPNIRALSAMSRGESPGPETVVNKLVLGTMMQEIAAFAMDLQGPSGAMTDPRQAEACGLFQALSLRAPAARVGTGTDEIMRNIIAERMLGLSADPRPGRDIPFDELIA